MVKQAPIPIYKQRLIGLERIRVTDSDGGVKMIHAKAIKGLLLIERKHFTQFIESPSMTDRLVNLNLLTSYHSNGQPKLRKNGKMPNTRTFYCLREWSKIDFNNLERELPV